MATNRQKEILDQALNTGRHRITFEAGPDELSARTMQQNLARWRQRERQRWENDLELRRRYFPYDDIIIRRDGRYIILEIAKEPTLVDPETGDSWTPSEARAAEETSTGEPFNEGWEAALAGHPEDINPWPAAYPQHDLWRAGWKRARESGAEAEPDQGDHLF